MKILVTGSEGSLMQHVIPELLAKGHQVIGVDSFYRYGRVDRERDYHFIEGDLYEKKFVDEITAGVDYIIQAAAIIYGVKGFHAYPADILSKDVTLHQNILWSALENGVKKVVYISSSMVFERCVTVPSKEEDVDDMQVPFTDYGLSKLVGERLSRAFHRQYGLAYCIWRPFNIITPFERAEQEIGFSHVFADFIERLIVMKENPLTIIGDGEQVRCFTWIGDVAAAIAEYSFDPLTDQEIFNLGNPVPITMKDLARKIFIKAQHKGLIDSDQTLAFKSIPAYADDVRVRIPAIEKAQRVLGWTPALSLDEALDLCIDEAAGYL